MASFEQLWSQTEPEKKKKKNFVDLWSETEDSDDGWWQTTKDVASKGYGYIPHPVQEGLEAVGGGMLTTLHQLGRPQSAIAGGLYNIFEERGEQAPDDDRSAWERYVTETLEGMKKGFTYEDEKRIQDIMAKANPEWVAQHPVMSTILGFAGDVVTDPLNLLGIGAVRHALGTVTGARKISKAIESSSLGKKIAEKADNPVLRALNVYTGDKKKAREMYMTMLDDIRGSHAQIARGAKLETKAMRKMAKSLGVSVDDLNRQILREAEGMAAASGVAANLTGAARTAAQREAEDMSKIFKGQLTSEQAGVPINLEPGMVGPPASRIAGSEIGDVAARGTELKLGRGLTGEAAETAYVPHILSQLGEKELRRLTKKYGSLETMADVIKNNPHAIKRQLTGTVEDINLRYGKNFFLTDAPSIKAARTASHAQVVASRNFLKDAAESLGRRAGAADTPADWVPIKGIEGVRFDPEIAQMVTKMHKTISDPLELAKPLKLIDAATKWWKMWSLGLRPAYHARNVGGNLWNAYNIGGMGPTDAYRMKQAMDIQRMSAIAPDTLAGRVAEGVARTGKFRGKIKVGKFGEHSNEDLWKMAQQDGILNRGQYGLGGDVGRQVEHYAITEAPKNKAASLAQWITPTTKNKLLHGGFAAGTALENNTRLALYLATLGKTGSRQAAKNNVKKALFDYKDLSPVEQNYLKRFIPFYTWSRKNIPAQIEALIKNPQRGVKVDHLIDNIQYGVDTPSLEETNEFLRGRNPVWVDKFMEGGGGDTHNAITLMNWLPVVDPNRLLDWKPMREGRYGGSGIPFPTLLAEMTNPFLKAPIEAFMNYDIFRRRDIQEYPGKTVDMVGIKLPVHLAKLAQNLVMLSELDRLNPPIRKEGEWTGVFGEATRDESGQVKKTRAAFTPPWQDEATLRESRVDQPVSMRLLQYLFGLRPYEDAGDQEKWDKKQVVIDIKTLRSLVVKEALRGNEDSVKNLLRRIDRVLGK